MSQTIVPQPRVAYAMHSARINQIRATPAFDRLVTISEDKSVRVWRMQDLQLIRSIYVPSDAGEEGALRSLAITPDGREVIVGGWTGVSFRGSAQLYRIDLATGEIRQTLRGFPTIVESLAISRDGKYLAIGLGGSGLRVVELNSGKVVFEDKQYAERIGFADYSVDGLLATTSQDGCLRIYDADYKLIFRAEYPPRNDDGSRVCKGSELGGVRFSPDGKRLAFGLQDRNEMVVMDVATRSIFRKLSIDDTHQRSLCCLNWSGDGQQLYMNGAHTEDTATPLYRVDLNSGAIESLAIGKQRFTNILPLPNGDIVFSTNAPSLSRYTGSGQKVAEALPPNGDFRFSWRNFRVSDDGSRISLPMRADNSDVRFFSLRDEPDNAYRPTQDDDMSSLQEPLRTGLIELQATLDEYGYKAPVKLNGQSLRLKPFQSVRSWAAAHERGIIAVGTQWSVLAISKEGKILWERDLPAPAYQVTISGNGQWVIAAVGDGSIRWYALSDGTEKVGLFLHNNGKDWVAWRADGYYASSPRGDEYIAWLVNRGDERSPDFFRAVQFERKLYRPDLVQLALMSEANRAITGAADLQATLRDLAPPRVTIEKFFQDSNNRITVEYAITPSQRAIREIGIYADGLPLLTAQERKSTADNVRKESRGILHLPPGISADQIRIEAETDVALGFDETVAAFPIKSAIVPGKLNILSIGVGEFEDAHRCESRGGCKIHIGDLPNAPNDAVEIVKKFVALQGKVFTSVVSNTISDNSVTKPTKRNIVEALGSLQNAGPNDTTIIFLASHGFARSASAAEYYFLPRDGLLYELATLLVASGDAVTATSSLLTASELSAALKKVAGRRLLIIDTCQSGVAGLGSNPYSLTKRSAAARYGVMFAASGNEQSYEAVSEPHGAFTWAILNALDGAADSDHDGIVTVAETFAFVGPSVAANMRRLNAMARSKNSALIDKAQTPGLETIASMLRAPLTQVNSAR